MKYSVKQRRKKIKKYHITKNDEKILISDMTNSHLIYTMRLYRKMARQGITEIRGVVGGEPGDPAVWQNEYRGWEALEYLEYEVYLQEFENRLLDGRFTKAGGME